MKNIDYRIYLISLFLSTDEWLDFINKLKRSNHGCNKIFYKKFTDTKNREIRKYKFKVKNITIKEDIHFKSLNFIKNFNKSKSKNSISLKLYQVC